MNSHEEVICKSPVLWRSFVTPFPRMTHKIGKLQVLPEAGVQAGKKILLQGSGGEVCSQPFG